MIFTRLLRCCLVVGLAGLALMPDTASGQKRGGTLVMLVQPEPPTLASYLSTSGPIGQVTTKVYEGLLEYDFNLKPIPGLAQSWTVSGDGKTISFKLHKGIKFSDGKPFTSADVKFSVLEVLKKFHPRGAITFRDVVDIETPDEHTAVFKLANPAPYLMMALSGYESPMLPKHLFEGTDIKNNKQANSPVGTGPYSDVKAPARLPQIEATTRGYEMQSPIVQLDFNTKRPPFDNQKVRQAVSYAISRKFVIDNVWFGFGKPATGPINSNFAVAGLYTPSVKSYNVPNGVEVANKLLDEAGLRRGPNGIRAEIVHDITPYGEEWQRYGEYVQQVLAEIGIKATLRHEDVPTWLRRIYTDYDFQLTN